jgi:hypothetical protein
MVVIAVVAVLEVAVREQVAIVYLMMVAALKLMGLATVVAISNQ